MQPRKRRKATNLNDLSPSPLPPRKLNPHKNTLHFPSSIAVTVIVTANSDNISPNTTTLHPYSHLLFSSPIQSQPISTAISSHPVFCRRSPGLATATEWRAGPTLVTSHHQCRSHRGTGIAYYYFRPLNNLNTRLVSPSLPHVCRDLFCWQDCGCPRVVFVRAGIVATS